jgi:hypothetical protein
MIRFNHLLRFGVETASYVDFSKDNLLKEFTQFKEGIDAKTSVFYQNFTEISTYISQNVLTNPEMAANVLSYGMQVATVGLGLYAANELKKRKSVDAFIGSIDNDSEKDFRVSNASSIFQDVENFYTFRRLNVIVGDKITNFLKKIVDVTLEAISNNVTHPVLDLAKTIMGNGKYNAMKDFINDNITEPIHNKVIEPISDFFKRKHTNSSDVIRMMEEKYNDSELNDLITNSSEVNVAQEVSKLAEEVYFSIQKIQLKQLITESVKTIKQSKEKIDSFGSGSLSFLQNRSIGKENKKIKKSMEVLKEVEFLCKKDNKKEALSKYTVLSEVANDFLKQINSQGILSFTSTNIDDFVDNAIKAKQEDIQKTYLSLSNTKYIPFIEKMIIPQDTSITELFDKKIDEFITGKEEELLNKKLATKTKLQSNLT